MCTLSSVVTQAVESVVEDLRAWLGNEPDAPQPEWFDLSGTLFDILVLWGSKGLG